MITDSSYKISIVNYFNTLPFVYGINHSGIALNSKFEFDIPSVCAQKLLNQQVDIGLVPVAILPKLEQYHLISDYCIGAIGKVDSVKLYSQKPIHELTDIILDYQSRTSVALIQVLNKNFWKHQWNFKQGFEGFENSATNTTGIVLIGDRTFGFNQYPYEYDLAEEWYKYTGLPFVFACWASEKKISDSFITKFNQVLGFGVNHINDALDENPLHIKGFDAKDYLKYKISYSLDDSKKEGLKLFLRLLKEL
jgi:chorismate dehydratase